MIRNYLTIAFRNLFNQGSITLINLLGLSLGLAASLMAFVFIVNEVTYDHNQPDRDRIYRITAGFKTFTFSATPYVMLDALKEDYPDWIESGLRTNAVSEMIVKVKGELHHERVLFTDSNYFDFFQVPLRYGSPGSVIKDPSSVVLSHEIAQKYYGTTDPVGFDIELKVDDEFRVLTVTGVAEPFPTNSSLHFSLLVPNIQYYQNKTRDKESWNSYHLTTFIKRHESKSIEGLEALLAGFIDRRLGDEETDILFFFEALDGHHLSDNPSGDGLKSGAKARNSIYIFSGIALLILVISSFNFINLSTARASVRSKEIGVRKTSGATRSQLRTQFILESMLLTGVSILLALGLAELGLILYTEILGNSLSLGSLLSSPWFWFGLTLFTILIGVLTGAYPAFLLSGMKIEDVFRNKYQMGGNRWFTKGMIFFQFVIASTLLTTALVLNLQQKTLVTQHLGFNQEGVVIIPIQAKNNDIDGANRVVPRFRQEALKQPGITALSSTTDAFTKGTSITMQEDSIGGTVGVYQFQIDQHYLETLELELLEGRNFSLTNATDTANTIIVNETFIKHFNITDPVGKTVKQSYGKLKNPVIIGVVRNFYFQSLKSPVLPVIFYMKQQSEPEFMLARIEGEDLKAKIESLQAIWQEIEPDKPFKYYFMDQEFKNLYQEQARWTWFITQATGVAIFLSCLGLLGLITFSIEKRRKEIGIRKVMGASIARIIMLLGRTYAQLVTLAFAVTIPLTLYFLNQWLNNFQSKITIGVPIYLITIVLLLFISFGSILLQAVRAARDNPVNALRNE